MTITICRGGRSSGLERHHPHDPGPWMRVYGEVYRRTKRRSKGRVVYVVLTIDFFSRYLKVR